MSGSMRPAARAAVTVVSGLACAFAVTALVAPAGLGPAAAASAVSAPVSLVADNLSPFCPTNPAYDPRAAGRPTPGRPGLQHPGGEPPSQNGYTTGNFGPQPFGYGPNCPINRQQPPDNNRRPVPAGNSRPAPSGENVVTQPGQPLVTSGGAPKFAPRPGYRFGPPKPPGFHPQPFPAPRPVAPMPQRVEPSHPSSATMIQPKR